MSMVDDAQDDLERVGYKRPPKAHQFQKGKSGNPRGRPKSKLTFLQTLERALDERVTVTVKGKQVAKSKRELAAITLANNFAKGDPKAMALYMAITKACSPVTGDQPAADDLTCQEQTTIDNFLSRWRGGTDNG
jgi:hypothetical protein